MKQEFDWKSKNIDEPLRSTFGFGSFVAVHWTVIAWEIEPIEGEFQYLHTGQIARFEQTPTPANGK